jgi:hypothetical protein
MATNQEIMHRLIEDRVLLKQMDERQARMMGMLTTLNGRVRHNEQALATGSETQRNLEARTERLRGRVMKVEDRERNRTIISTTLAALFSAIAGFIGWQR